MRPAHIAVAALSALVLVVTGFAWRSVDSLRDNLATADGLGLGGGKDGAVDILLVGTDSRTDAHGKPLSQSELDELRSGADVSTNTDTIVLVRIPNDGKSATALSIPRDSYVKVPGLGMTKINGAYGATKESKRAELVESGVADDEADKQGTKAGRQALIKSVADLTGVTVDRYAEIGLLGFVLLTKAVGGVEVCLNQPVDEPFSGAHFPAGKQTISGADALSFVRQRHDLERGDLDRIVRQQVFMASLVRKVLSAKTLSNPGKLDELSTAITRSVVLDSDWDILKFARQLQDLAGGAVRFDTIPVVDGNAVNNAGESIVQIDPTAVHTYVKALVGEAKSPDKPQAPTLDKSTVTVDVANSSGITGLAAKVADDLSAKGFGKGTVGNNSGKDVSVTTIFAGDETVGNAVAAELGNAPVVKDTSLSKNSVRVVLAGDYSGTSTAASPSSSSAAQTPPPIDAGGQGGPKCVN